MKTKVQKGEELKKAKALLDKSHALIFADFTKITAEDVRKLRIELKKSGANFLVIKKRLLGLLLKEKGIEGVNLNQFKTSVGTIFAEENMEGAAGPAFKFFSTLAVLEGGAKDMWIKHLLSGYDLKSNTIVDSAQIIYIGKLPSREVLLGQLLGMLSAPIRSFLYVLDQKAKQGGGGSTKQSEAAAEAPAAEKVAVAAPAASEAAAPAGDSNSSDTKSDTDNPEQKVELTQAQ
jgi:large subunit ribosomal protein L10